MARIFQVKGLEEKKRALAAECEVYRQTLQLEVQNLRLYAMRTQRKFSSVLTPNPLLMFAVPFVGSFLRKRLVKRARRNRFVGLALAAMSGWRLYRKVGPSLGSIVARLRSSSKFHPNAVGDSAPANNQKGR